MNHMRMREVAMPIFSPMAAANAKSFPLNEVFQPVHTSNIEDLSIFGKQPSYFLPLFLVISHHF
jgi:hypothetical protein